MNVSHKVEIYVTRSFLYGGEVKQVGEVLEVSRREAYEFIHDGLADINTEPEQEIKAEPKPITKKAK